MPNQNDINKARERRERRKAAREAAVEQAHVQEQNLTETLEKAKAAAPRKAAPRKPPKEQRAEERAAAEAEATKQEQTIKVDESEVVVSRIQDRPLTLHELNKLARQQTRHFRLGARTVARAAGKAAYNAAMSGEAPHLGPSKHQRIYNAQTALAKAKTDKSEK